MSPMPENRKETSRLPQRMKTGDLDADAEADEAGVDGADVLGVGRCRTFQPIPNWKGNTQSNHVTFQIHPLLLMTAC